MNTEQERAAFEAWAKERGMTLHKASPCDGSSPYYLDTASIAAWEAWQARAALAAPAAPQAGADTPEAIEGTIQVLKECGGFTEQAPVIRQLRRYATLLAAAPTPPAQAAPGDEEIKQPTNVIDGKVYKQQWFTWNEVRALLSRYGQAAGRERGAGEGAE